MKTWYCSIVPVNEPRDAGPDDAARVQLEFDVVAMRRSSASFVEELLEILSAARVGAAKVNIFAGSTAVIPSGPGPFLHILPTGGLGPLGTHNDGSAAYRRPGAKITVRAATMQAAAAMVHAAYTALASVRNRAVPA